MTCTCQGVVGNKSILLPPSLPLCLLPSFPPFQSFAFDLDGDIGFLPSSAAVLCLSRLLMQTWHPWHPLWLGIQFLYLWRTKGWVSSLEIHSQGSKESGGLSASTWAANGLRMDSGLMTQLWNVDFTGGAMVLFSFFNNFHTICSF